MAGTSPRDAYEPSFGDVPPDLIFEEANQAGAAKI
jgi:hypothetical protein